MGSINTCIKKKKKGNAQTQTLNPNKHNDRKLKNLFSIYTYAILSISLVTVPYCLLQSSILEFMVCWVLRFLILINSFNL